MADNHRNPNEPLEAPFIRLLEINAGTGTDPLRCRRICVNLDSFPEYEALSYAWGDTHEREFITCDALPVSVTANLKHALSRLRLPDSTRRLWVDAICIDQSNNDEKACQIPLMGQIYSTASKVLVWLGNVDSVHSTEASQAIHFISTSYRIFKEKVDLDDEYEDDAPLRGLSKELGPAAEESLVLLYAATWFTRVWCVQEITKATDSRIYWGEQEFLWSDVGLVAKYLGAITPEVSSEYGEGAIYAKVPFDNAERLFDINKSRHDLVELLDNFRNFSATNPRDKVYGLLGLAESIEEAQSVHVDYNKGIGEVYADFTRAMIQKYKELTTLVHVDHQSEYSKREGFPSWAPAWDKDNALRRIPALYSDLGAHGEMDARILDGPDTNPYHLILCGLFYSEITFVYEEMDLQKKYSGQSHPFIKIYCSLMDQYCTKEVGVMRFLCLARTLTAGGDAYQNDVDFADQAIQTEFYGDFTRFLKSRFTTDGDTGADDATPIGAFYHEAEVVCNGRRVFKTANGSFGLGPGCMRETDIAVVLFGGDSVYILRPHGDTYLFMGQAYIDELMQGKLVDEFEAGRIQEQAFCLV